MEDLDFKELAEISDPLEKTLRANSQVTRYQEAVNELLRIRREGVEGLIEGGMKPAQIARHLGVSRQAVAKLIKNSPPPERAFLGHGQLTIAVGEKREAAKEHGLAGPTVATEDLAAYNMLASLSREMKLNADYEVIRPPGFIELNRQNLVVVCGPRLSPMIGQILASDTNLGFEKDERGWYLTDSAADQVYRSPMDAGANADYAYFGRLPRPDGRGTFLYIAGIHAVGATGVTHWLANNLTEVYAEVRKRRFSCLIRCEFDQETMSVTHSERVTPFYLRSGGTA